MLNQEELCEWLRSNNRSTCKNFIAAAEKIERLQSLLDAARETPWNKCLDGLPEAGRVYLAIEDLNGSRKKGFLYLRKSGLWYEPTGYPVDGEVTHWMEVPELPELSQAGQREG